MNLTIEAFLGYQVNGGLVFRLDSSAVAQGGWATRFYTAHGDDRVVRHPAAGQRPLAGGAGRVRESSPVFQAQAGVAAVHGSRWARWFAPVRTGDVRSPAGARGQHECAIHSCGSSARRSQRASGGRGSLDPVLWRNRYSARTIGPATSCGKKLT